jgi:cellulose synthase/poly-beta-1,6-N-acetylglucosamine synthase-like glycosyltransferase
MLTLALVSLGVLVYTYLGYPALVALLARLYPLQQPRDPDYVPTVSVCMAVYNGAAYLDAKLESLIAQDWPPHKLEFLIYSDGCTDNTEALVRNWASRDRRVKLVRGEQRLGKPTGLNRLRDIATGEVILITDVRQPLSAGAVRALVERLADPRVGCVSGNLVLKGAAGSGAYWRYEKFIRQKEATFRSVVGMTGSIAMIRKADLPRLPRDLILDDVWIPMRLRLEGRLILFAEDAQAYDVAFEDDREFGRKVRTLAGNYQLFAWMPALLSPFSNPSWFETVSHKWLRLVSPWALLALVVSCGVALLRDPAPVPRALVTSLLGAQGLFYLAATIGPRAGKLGSLCRTFVVMNAAALVGLWRFLTGRQQVTW